MFKQRKHKRFNYQPRFQDTEKSTSDDLETKWDKLRSEVRGQSSKRLVKPMSLKKLVILLVFIVVLMYILEGYIN